MKLPNREAKGKLHLGPSMPTQMEADQLRMRPAMRHPHRAPRRTRRGMTILVVSHARRGGVGGSAGRAGARGQFDNLREVCQSKGGQPDRAIGERKEGGRRSKQHTHNRRAAHAFRGAFTPEAPLLLPCTFKL